MAWWVQHVARFDKAFVMLAWRAGKRSKSGASGSNGEPNRMAFASLGYRNSSWCGGVVALCSSLLVACAQSPTGRSQMLLYSPQQMSQLGADSFEQPG